MTTSVRHGAVTLALHALGDGGAARPLLLLHALGGASADWGDVARVWPGPAHALDFSGHGASGWRPGGAYTPELLAADADAALAQLGECCIAGAGVGAYVALLLAGGRPALVQAALLLPGAGLHGGGAEPDPARPLPPALALAPACDPMVTWCDRDVRPAAYAEAFAAVARRLVLAEDGAPRPPWWSALAAIPGVARTSLDRRAALGTLAPL
jgi:pimeloyl-ACP methyl ester carboxylesterase